MAAIGSVFLGDLQQRLRLFSSPPSSPSAAMAENPTAPAARSNPEAPPSGSAPPLIEPALSLELRLRWLEAILLGVRQDVKTRRGTEKVYELKNGEALSRVVDDIQRRLNGVVEQNDGLKRFMDHCSSPFPPPLVYI